MTDELRAAIVFIAGNKDKSDNRNLYTRLFDHKRTKFIAYNLQKSPNGSINMYDYDRGTYLNGIERYIYDFETKTSINMNYLGNQFTGTDMNSGECFQGSINGNSIYIYDNKCNEYYNYTIS